MTQKFRSCQDVNGDDHLFPAGLSMNQGCANALTPTFLHFCKCLVLIFRCQGPQQLMLIAALGSASPFLWEKGPPGVAAPAPAHSGISPQYIPHSGLAVSVRILEECHHLKPPVIPSPFPCSLSQNVLLGGTGLINKCILKSSHLNLNSVLREQDSSLEKHKQVLLLRGRQFWIRALTPVALAGPPFPDLSRSMSDSLGWCDIRVGRPWTRQSTQQKIQKSFLL